MKKHLLALLMGFSSVTAASSVVAADVDFPHLETVGIGEVVATPDMAEFTVQIVEEQETAQQAKQAADKVVVAFHQRLKEMGVSRNDIESGNIQLNPQYSYPKNAKPKLEGYRATRTITVRVFELAKLNEILDGALGDGINRINQISLKVKDETRYQEAARLAAIKDAQQKAKSLAAGFGEHIDGVWQIRYHNGPSQPPVLMRAMAMDSSIESQASYQDSEIVIRDQVDVVFRLEE